MSEKARLRKIEDDLNVGGAGIIILGVWSIVKVLIVAFLGTRDSLDLESENPGTRVIVTLLVIAMIAVTSVIVMTIHLYIGLNAMRAAKGREHKKGYYTAAVIMLIISVLGLASYWEDIRKIEHIDTTIASILVDLTSIYVYAIIIKSTLRINKLKEKDTEGLN